MERGKEGVCMCQHVFVYTCCMQKLVSQQCLPPRNTASMLTDSQTHIHMHVLSIQQFTGTYVNVSMCMLLSLTIQNGS